MGDVLHGDEDYQSYFDPDTYLNDYFLETGVFWPFFVSYMECLQKIYDQGQVKGKRIIDIGCGPTIHSVIPATKWFDEIYLADFAQSNIDAIQKWLRKDSGAFNWNTFFKFFAEKDGKGDAWQQYEDTLRAKVKKLLHCDVNKTNPIIPETLEKFDAVTTCLALQSGASDVSQYKTAMKNVASLLKPGGYIIEAAELECPDYDVGSKKFLSVYLTKDDILTAFKVSGVEVLQVFDEPVLIASVSSKPFGLFVVLGKKL